MFNLNNIYLNRTFRRCLCNLEICAHYVLKLIRSPQPAISSKAGTIEEKESCLFRAYPKSVVTYCNFPLSIWKTGMDTL